MSSLHNAFLLHECYDVPWVSSKSQSLQGVRLAVKDNIHVQWMPTTCASKILEWYTAPYTATCIENLVGAWAEIVWKTNMDEFAQWSANENSAFGPVTNPFDISRIPWGSSWWSAVAVAIWLADLALWTDTWWSIRLPAALCGVVWVKPTYWAVSRYWVQAMTSSFDQVWLFARNVAEIVSWLDALIWYDPNDATSSPRADKIQWTLVESVNSSESAKQFRIAVPKQAMGCWADEDVLEAFTSTLDALRTQWVQVDEIDLPELDWTLPIYYIINPAEVSSNHARFDWLRFWASDSTDQYERIADYYQHVRSKNLWSEVIRRTLLGAYVLSAWHYDAYYQKAKALQRVLRSKFNELFETYDAICTPVSPSPAWKLWEHWDDPVSSYLKDIYTVPANIIWAPAMSVPMQWSERDWVLLPNWFHIIAKPWNESVMLKLWALVESTIWDRTKLYSIPSWWYSTHA